VLLITVMFCVVCLSLYCVIYISLYCVRVGSYVLLYCIHIVYYISLNSASVTLDIKKTNILYCGRVCYVPVLCFSMFTG